MKRIEYLRRLRELIPTYGSENIVYIDESGFKKYAYRMDAWAKRGKKVYGDVSGNNRKCTNLIMAWRKKKWIAPETFEGSCTAQKFLDWFTKKLLPILDKPSVIIMDTGHPLAQYYSYRHYKIVRFLFKITIVIVRRVFRGASLQIL
jgi:hypothetical protein